MTDSWRMGSVRTLGFALLAGWALVLSGCGGPVRVAPTPVPADVVRPVQNTPVFPEQMAIPPAPTLTPTPTLDRTQAAPTVAATPSPTPRAAQVPRSAAGTTALAIVSGGGAALAETPGGPILRTVAAGGVLNVTGRSEDGRWLAAFTDDRVAGWVEAGRVTLFGGEGLAVVAASSAGGAVIAAPTEAAAQTEAAATPASASTLPPAAPASESSGVAAVVQAPRLNVRAGPGTDYGVVAGVQAGAELAVLGRNADLTWVRVALPEAPGGYGWVSAGLVALLGEIDSIPLSTETSGEPVSQSAPAAGSVAAAAGVSASAAGLQGVLVFQTSSGGEIYAYNLATGNLRLLTRGMDPAISPDGRWVAFVRGGGESGVYRMGVEGGGETRIYGGNDPRTPTWSGDGQFVLFSHKIGQVRCYDLGLGGCIPEADAQNFFNSLPPQQQQQVQSAIASGEIRLIDRELRGLARVDRDGGSYQDVPALNTAYAPDWNSGGAIVYQSAGGLQITGDGPGAATQAISPEAGFQDPAWQADYGRLVFHSRQGGHWQIFAINPDGSGLVGLTRPSPIPSGQSSSLAPAWSPDGRAIVFISNRGDGVWRLWVMDAQGANQRQLPISVPLDYRYQGEQVVGWGR